MHFSLCVELPHTWVLRRMIWLPSDWEGGLPHPHFHIVCTVNISCEEDLTEMRAVTISSLVFNTFSSDEEQVSIILHLTGHPLVAS